MSDYHEDTPSGLLAEYCFAIDKVEYKQRNIGFADKRLMAERDRLERRILALLQRGMDDERRANG